MGFFDKLFGKKEKEDLNKGLEKTKQNFFSKIYLIRIKVSTKRA